MSSNWPTHSNGRPMKIGDMTPEQRLRIGMDAARKLETELRHPTMVAAINAPLPAPVEQPPETMRLAPTWKGILPLLFAAMEHGTDRARDAAKEELRQMAEAADRWNAAQGDG